METYTGVDYNMDHDTTRETLPGSMGVFRQVYLSSKYNYVTGLNQFGIIPTVALVKPSPI
jgi:hypothetical protein